MYLYRFFRIKKRGELNYENQKLKVFKQTNRGKERTVWKSY